MASDDPITIKAYRANGHCYRHWPASNVFQNEVGVVTFSPRGTKVSGDEGGWISSYNIRAFYWLKRPYNLLEVYDSNQNLVEICIHIASPARISGAELHDTDYELDVVMEPGQAPRIVDADDFDNAIEQYGYSPEFQEACRPACHKALKLAKMWNVGEPPDSGLTAPA